MPRHGENIFKRKDGRWEGRYIFAYNEFGKSVYKSVYGKTYSETKQKLEKAKAEKSCTAKSNDVNSFGDLLYYWLKFQKVKNKETTQNKYEFLIDKHIFPELGQIKLNKLTNETINRFISEKIQILSVSYVHTMAVIIKSSLNLAVKERFIVPVYIEICLPKEQKPSPEVLSVEEQYSLENYLKNNDDLTAVGILISLYAGLRVGEVCALRWEDIDFDNSVMKVNSTVARIKEQDGKIHTKITSTKTKSSVRNIPLTKNLFDLLSKRKEQSCSPFVISDSYNFVNQRTYEYRYHKILKNAGIKDYKYHSLRHTFATRCIECGMDVKSLSEILGHSNVSTTLNIYVHSSMDFKKAQIEKLDSFVLQT